MKINFDRVENLPFGMRFVPSHRSGLPRWLKRAIGAVVSDEIYCTKHRTSDYQALSFSYHFLYGLRLLVAT